MPSSETSICEPVRRLRDRGVQFPLPATTWVSDDVPVDHVAPGVVIHPGSRVSGAETSIGPGCVLGADGPVTLQDCQLGHGVHVAGGSVTGATLLDHAALGPGAHVRAGTLMEEQSSAAHSVGLKQTILMPFVTLGSLINFCDCLMAGGTSRRNHSEVGSSYVHFNFTPHGDKVTASLIGDVPHGVLLNQPPIFLGGHGGLVGPRRIAYGSVIVAGAICRSDVLKPNRLVSANREVPGGQSPYTVGLYSGSRRRMASALAYIGNILALRQWYRDVRRDYMDADPYRARCRSGAEARLDAVLAERESRLQQWIDKLPHSLACMKTAGGGATHPEYEIQQNLMEAWPGIQDRLASLRASRDSIRPAPGGLVTALADGEPTASWPDRVHALSPDLQAAAVDWLQGMVDTVQGLWQATA